MNNWKKVGALIAPLVPLVGGAIAGPAGAAIAGMLADKLGVDKNSPASLEAAIQANPQHAAEMAREIERTKRTMIESAHAEAIKELELAGKQVEVNKVEAAHKSLFVAGGRPAALWMCVLALGWHFLVQPVLDYALLLFDVIPPRIEFDTASLMTILTGLLGLGGLRSFEKYKRVAREK